MQVYIWPRADCAHALEVSWVEGMSGETDSKRFATIKLAYSTPAQADGASKSLHAACPSCQWAAQQPTSLQMETVCASMHLLLHGKYSLPMYNTSPSRLLVVTLPFTSSYSIATPNVSSYHFTSSLDFVLQTQSPGPTVLSHDYVLKVTCSPYFLRFLDGM